MIRPAAAITRASRVEVDCPLDLERDELAIARSVLYAALFDYPLTLAQLRETLIATTHTASEILDIYDRSSGLQAIVERVDGYFVPKGRGDLVAERQRREARSRTFLADHSRLLQVVCALPFVRLVALSGSIAHMNLERGGDLDLFIVTRGRHVWSTTVLVLVIAKAMRRRRSVCANFVLADNRLWLDQEDLFTASQIVHLKPLIGRELLQQLVAANPFVARFYPNFHPGGFATVPFRQSLSVRLLKRTAELAGAAPLYVLERAARLAYRWHLRQQASTWASPDQVRLERDCLKLHTRSHRHSVLARFDRSVQELLHRP